MAHPAVKAFIQTLAPGILNSASHHCQYKHFHTGASRGFTLLELLVVIVIVAILFTLSVFSIRGSSPEDLIQEEARRLDRLLQLALEEAVLKGEEYGLEFSTHSYRFLMLDENNNWQIIETDRLLRERTLPQEMEVELVIEQIDVVVDDNEDSDEDKLKPQVFLLSSGEITPEFAARFIIPRVETSYLVEGSFDGQHAAKISEL